MTAITYTAKRNYVKGAFIVTGTDIAANGTLDQFESSSSDLSGLSTSDNIYVTGFDNTENNGWHIVSSASSSTIIPVTASALTTESAGNDIAIQEYLHVDGIDYNLETGAGKLEIYENPITAEAVSQGGLRQSIISRIDQGWEFATDYIHVDNLAYWREFTHSVAARETFMFDAYGTIASPDDPLTVIMDGKATWSRINRYYFTLSFRVIEA